jgi:hypothetical protein
MERDPLDEEPVGDAEPVEPPPFDPDPNLLSFLERGKKDDPKKVWTQTRNASR